MVQKDQNRNEWKMPLERPFLSERAGRKNKSFNRPLPRAKGYYRQRLLPRPTITPLLAGKSFTFKEAPPTRLGNS